MESIMRFPMAVLIELQKLRKSLKLLITSHPLPQEQRSGEKTWCLHQACKILKLDKIRKKARAVLKLSGEAYLQDHCVSSHVVEDDNRRNIPGAPILWKFVKPPLHGGAVHIAGSSVISTTLDNYLVLLGSSGSRPVKT